ncbi:MAG: lipoyl(octanoyl) transferase LipB [Ignavibacteriaceae bacterium]|nr:lipoyl(octanoyl) transferase LipB [Ignavibacteriaceae bacterium]
MQTEKQSISRKLVVIDHGLVEYNAAWDIQRDVFSKRTQGAADDHLLFFEHPNTYTLGKTASKTNLIGSEDFLRENGFSVVDIDRGGDITYHGPGQIVGYPIISLTEWHQDAHLYLRSLEEVLIRVCEEYGLSAGRKEKYTGVWIGERKIAAIGIKISRWVTMHGFAFNVNTNLDLFNGIIPCGIKDKDVTSLARELNNTTDMKSVKTLILKHFAEVFGYNTLSSGYPVTPN